MSNEILTYIPHRGEMALLDSIELKNKDEFITLVKISENSILLEEQGVPSYCAVEFMAQSIAAYNSIFFSGENNSNIGFMVSVRSFHSTTKLYKPNSVLRVKISPELIVSNSGTFSCSILEKDQELTTARITAYVPSDDELNELKKEANEIN